LTATRFPSSRVHLSRSCHNRTILCLWKW